MGLGPKKNQCGRVIAKAIERKNGLIRTEIDSTARHGSRETDGVDARRRSHGRYVLCMCHTHKTAQRTAIASSSITNGARETVWTVRDVCDTTMCACVCVYDDVADDFWVSMVVGPP